MEVDGYASEPRGWSLVLTMGHKLVAAPAAKMLPRASLGCIAATHACPTAALMAAIVVDIVGTIVRFGSDAFTTHVSTCMRA